MAGPEPRQPWGFTSRTADCSGLEREPSQHRAAPTHLPEYPQHGARLAQALAELLHACVAQLVAADLQLQEELVLGQHRAEVGAAGSGEAAGLDPVEMEGTGPRWPEATLQGPFPWKSLPRALQQRCPPNITRFPGGSFPPSCLVLPDKHPHLSPSTVPSMPPLRGPQISPHTLLRPVPSWRRAHSPQ